MLLIQNALKKQEVCY